MAEKKKFLLRIDAALWNDLQAWAADELRSVNGQIEYLLKRAVQARRRIAASPPPPAAPEPTGRADDARAEP
jgi:hypothetical protein